MSYTPKSTKFGFRDGLLWSADFSATRDDKNLWTGSESFHCALSDATRLAPVAGAPCQHPGFGFMLCSGVTINNEEGDIAKVTVKYGGSDNEGDDESKNSYTYDLSIVDNEEPLISHYKYKDIDLNEKKYIRNFQSGKFVPVNDDSPYKLKDAGDHEKGKVYEVTSTLGKELLDFIAKGVETYVAPAQTWRVTYTSKNNVPASWLNKVGKITSALNAPAISDSRNWLFNGCNVTQENKIFKITLEWRLSGAGGWHTEIYN